MRNHATLLTDARDCVAATCAWHTTTAIVACSFSLIIPRVLTESSRRCAFILHFSRSAATRRSNSIFLSPNSDFGGQPLAPEICPHPLTARRACLNLTA